MKKALSIVLALLMLISCFGVVGFAAEDAEQPGKYIKTGECKCENHNPDGPCHCCLFCENLDRNYITSCAVQLDEHTWEVCCEHCTGIWPNCGCDCPCCQKDDDVISPDRPLLPEDVQNNITTVFQNLLKRFTDAINTFFTVIFEFLRIDDLKPKA